jgi:glycosyltransferase involved in cell wall biosynthesis
MAAMTITPMILTFNEAPNIARTLEKLAWAGEILVVDSGSTDGTLEIVQANPRVRVVHRAFDSFAAQCNFGLDHVRTEWVLSLDADYVLTDDLVAELSTLDENTPHAGFTARFIYCVHGHRLRSSLYPPRTSLYRRSLAVYENDGHGHKVRVTGSTAMLDAAILHDDRKPLDRWFGEQIRYAGKEAAKLASTPASELNRPDRIRQRIWCAPLLVLAYTLFARRLILDGWPGWFYAFQRLLAEVMLSLKLLEHRFTR